MYRVMAAGWMAEGEPTHPKAALEIFGRSYLDKSATARRLRKGLACPFVETGKCHKMTKGRRDEAIPLGTCSVGYRDPGRKLIVPHIICPTRIKGMPAVFKRASDLLETRGEGILRLAEHALLDTSLDYVLAAVNDRRAPTKVLDFLGLEIQALDTTGSVFQAREDFLAGRSGGPYRYGINWAMSLAKTTLQQASVSGSWSSPHHHPLV